MFGDTIDVDKDSKRYNELLNQGFLPSQAIKKIETDKRLGIKPEAGFDIGLVKIAIVGLVIITGYSILKKKLVPPTPTQLSIDTIPGIDLNALSICRQQGLL